MEFILFFSHWVSQNFQSIPADQTGTSAASLMLVKSEDEEAPLILHEELK